MSTTPTVTSMIHDLGYQRYTGQRLGRGHIVRSMYTHAIRTAFGLGRGAKTKIFPWSIAGIVGAVAVVATAIQARTGERVLDYFQFSDSVGFLTVLYVAAVAPELVSRDLGSGVLVLYFSRPPGYREYALAKLAALVSAVWLLLGVPQLVMFAGAAFSSEGSAGTLFDETLDLAGGLLFAGGHAFVVASAAVLAAATTRRRAFAAAAVCATFIVTTPVIGVMTALGNDPVPQLAGLANPLMALSGLGRWVFGGDSGFDVGSFGPLYLVTCVAMVVLCTGLLLARYRRVRL
jgi:ABC-2 type transport system permease protein